jgi:hypothetical protein
MRRHSIILLTLTLIEFACAHTNASRKFAAVTPAADVVEVSWKPDELRRFTNAARLQQLIGNPYVDAVCTGIAPLQQLTLDIYVKEEAAKSYEAPLLPGIPKEAIRVKPVRQGFTALSARMGTSTSTLRGCSVGTLGIAARDNDDPTITGYITCNHVAASMIGCLEGEESLQVAPATCDSPTPDCSPGATIGKRMTSAPIPNPSNTIDVDAAFVASNSIDAANECGICSRGVVIAPEDILGKPVRKCGRTTSFTCGVVTGIGCTVNVRYPCDPVMLVNQIRVSFPGFARKGDSGAALFSADGGVVGLVFAGNGDDIAWANPMEAVLRELNVSLFPTAGCRSQPECLQVPTAPLLGCPGSP